MVGMDVHRTHDVVVGRVVGHGVIGVVAAAHRAGYDGVRSARAGRPLHVIAVEVRLAVVVPVEANLPVSRGPDQPGGRPRRSHVGRSGDAEGDALGVLVSRGQGEVQAHERPRRRVPVHRSGSRVHDPKVGAVHRDALWRVVGGVQAETVEEGAGRVVTVDLVVDLVDHPDTRAVGG